jgi:hypothetical protein
MTTNTTIKKLYQLVDIPDFRYSKDSSSIDYGDIASDCDTKTVSIFEAINHISLNIFSIAEDKEISKERY